jgi:hypothetical protein
MTSFTSCWFMARLSWPSIHAVSAFSKGASLPVAWMTHLLLGLALLGQADRLLLDVARVLAVVHALLLHRVLGLFRARLCQQAALLHLRM